MAFIIQLKGLPLSANANDVRVFFDSLSIPDGGVHIVGGDEGQTFITFSSDEDARLAMQRNQAYLCGSQISLFLSSRAEMQRHIEQLRQENTVLPPPQISNYQPPPIKKVKTPLLPIPILQSDVPSLSNEKFNHNQFSKYHDGDDRNISSHNEFRNPPQFNENLHQHDSFHERRGNTNLLRNEDQNRFDDVGYLTDKRQLEIPFEDIPPLGSEGPTPFQRDHRQFKNQRGKFSDQRNRPRSQRNDRYTDNFYHEEVPHGHMTSEQQNFPSECNEFNYESDDRPFSHDDNDQGFSQRSSEMFDNRRFARNEHYNSDSYRKRRHDHNERPPNFIIEHPHASNQIGSSDYRPSQRTGEIRNTRPEFRANDPGSFQFRMRPPPIDSRAPPFREPPNQFGAPPPPPPPPLPASFPDFNRDGIPFFDHSKQPLPNFQENAFPANIPDQSIEMRLDQRHIPPCFNQRPINPPQVDMERDSLQFRDHDARKRGNIDDFPSLNVPQFEKIDKIHHVKPELRRQDEKPSKVANTPDISRSVLSEIESADDGQFKFFSNFTESYRRSDFISDLRKAGVLVRPNNVVYDQKFRIAFAFFDSVSDADSSCRIQNTIPNSTVVVQQSSRKEYRNALCHPPSHPQTGFPPEEKREEKHYKEIPQKRIPENVCVQIEGIGIGVDKKAIRNFFNKLSCLHVVIKNEIAYVEFNKEREQISALRMTGKELQNRVIKILAIDSKDYLKIYEEQKKLKVQSETIIDKTRTKFFVLKIAGISKPFSNKIIANWLELDEGILYIKCDFNAECCIMFVEIKDNSKLLNSLAIERLSTTKLYGRNVEIYSISKTEFDNKSFNIQKSLQKFVDTKSDCIANCLTKLTGLPLNVEVCQIVTFFHQLKIRSDCIYIGAAKDNRRCGIIGFQTVTDCQGALQRNRCFLGTCMVFVAPLTLEEAEKELPPGIYRNFIISDAPEVDSSRNILMIKHIPKSINAKSLQEYLKPSRVLGITFMRSANIAFVDMQDSSAVRLALTKSGVSIENNIVELEPLSKSEMDKKIEEFKKNTKKTQNSSPISEKKELSSNALIGILMKNLPFNVVKQDIVAFFGEAASSLSPDSIIINSIKPLMSCEAIVRFSSVYECEQAAKCHKNYIGPKQVELERKSVSELELLTRTTNSSQDSPSTSQKPVNPDSINSRTIQVAGLPLEIGVGDLLQFFNGFNPIPSSLEVKSDHYHRCCTAYLAFETANDAIRALRAKNRSLLNTRRVVLTIKSQ